MRDGNGEISVMQCDNGWCVIIVHEDEDYFDAADICMNIISGTFVAVKLVLWYQVTR